MIFTSLKLFSALIIVGACFFAGAALADAEAASYRQLSGMLALLAHIRTRITYTHFSLEVIFSDFYDEALEKCGFLGCLKDGRGGYSAAFCEAVERLSLTGEARDITYGQEEYGTITVTLDTQDDIPIAEVMTFDVTRDGEPFTVSEDNHASLTYDGKTATFTARDAGTYALTPRLTEVLSLIHI